MFWVAMSWKVSNDVDAPNAASHSRSSPGRPACTGTLVQVAPLLSECATATEPPLRLDTYARKAPLASAVDAMAPSTSPPTTPGPVTALGEPPSLYPSAHPV